MPKWEKWEKDYLKKVYPDTNIKIICKYLNRKPDSIYRCACKLGIKRTKEYISNLCREQAKNNKGFIKTQFKSKYSPSNKGQKMDKELYDKCSPTMFKKGNKPSNTKEVGYLSLRADGYIYIKIADSHWELLQRYVYEKFRGKIPCNHNIIFRNGNKTDFDISNLVAISNSELMSKNSIHNYPQELKETLLITAKLRRQINKLKNK